MVNLYDKKKKLAKELLEIALQYNHLDYYLMGYPGFFIEKISEDGKVGMDVVYSVEAIYDYFNSHENSTIDKEFFDVILREASSNLSVESLVNLLDVIRYHIQNERNGHAPFRTDDKQLLGAMKNNITNNKDHFTKKPINGTTNFVDYFEEINDEIGNIYH